MQQSNASTSNHATRHTHSQDTTATHRSGKLVNYKRLVCFEHCPRIFGYTFVISGRCKHYIKITVFRDVAMCGFVQRFGADYVLRLHGNLRFSCSSMIMDTADFCKILVFLYQFTRRHFGKLESLSTLSWGPQISQALNIFRVCHLCPPNNFGIQWHSADA